MSQQSMFRRAAAALMAVVLLGLAACGGGSSPRRQEGEFEAFVLDRFAETDDTTHPTSLEGRVFADRTTVPADAFDSVLGG
ncbi:MAG: hypothetical protein R3F05_17375 [Planctomycetota bacterium]